MRIAIVNDMPLAIEAMRRVLLDSTAHTIAWIARDGAQAVKHCASDTPDLILMDLIMPVMDGVEATKRIMRKHPCAILIVTASVLGNSGRLFEAMGAGALDAVQTPVLGAKTSNGAAVLLYKIDSIGQLIGRMEGIGSARVEPPQATGDSPAPLVLIGASAGGPGALAEILSTLPKDFSAGLVVVQHVDAQFVAGLADWLNTKSQLPVCLAREGDEIKPGTVLLAGGDEHLIFRNGRSLSYTREPRECLYSPSIDVFFQSAARHWKGKAIGVVLTGMGRDGAAGLKQLRETGHHTIAQDRATSAVYGMPKAAAELGAAVSVLPLENIAAALVHIVGQPVAADLSSQTP
jgi:chemotaxis response regulator CheB